ncbi:GAF domain-containing protein [Amycolatopsis mediterranei]|uniref:GAF domain-containing sensor histidine kinase n=1 Tax=Amycolatopsis mediterranei TaxID=33910 RepID=UPI001E4B0E7D|nr:GAF domain-containing protein [Amycolatopsis mediterranei]UZF67168.1 histidine kinase [Amycolatopsis mediterranei]
MTELMDPTLAARALSAATEITSTALSGDDPGAVLDTVVARAAELADADLGLAMVSTEDGRVVVEAAHYATAHPASEGIAHPLAPARQAGDGPVSGPALDTDRGGKLADGASGTGAVPTTGGRRDTAATASAAGEATASTAPSAPAGDARGDSPQPSGSPEPLPGPASAGDSLRGLALPADSAAGQVARGGEPVSSADFTVDPRTAPYVPAELHGYGPFAAAPFGSGGRVLGSLTVYRKRGREPFSAGTVEMLVAFAAQAGVVLALAEGANARHRVALYEERERIARELHDVIVQRLYGAGMQLDRVRRNMRKRFAQADGARLSDAIDQLDQTIEEIRGTVRALRSPEPRHDTGTPADLAESARGEVRIAGELLGYPPTLELSGEFADVPAERADHIRAALREALSNVVRHSGASETRVTLTRDSGGVKLRVRDNGSGVPQGVATRGLRHLAERADAAGGKFFLNSSPSLGTLVAFDLPLD